jgi:hypothetical protein
MSWLLIYTCIWLKLTTVKAICMMTYFGEIKMKRFSLSLALCAAIILTSCASLVPNSDFNAALVAGDAAMESADWNKAALKYEEAASLQPANLDVKLKQALAYQRAGKLAKAYNLYQIIIESGKLAGNEEAVKTAKMNQAKFGFNAQTPEATETKEAQALETKDVVSFYASTPNETTEEPASTTPLTTPEAIVAAEQSTESSPIAPSASTPSISTITPADAKEVLLNKAKDWAKAWQSKDLNSYFAHYSKDFSGEFADNAAWRKARSKKINGAKKLNVEVADFEIISADENNAKISFTQKYRSNLYQDSGKKTMELKQIDGSWLVVVEQFVKQ